MSATLDGAAGRNLHTSRSARALVIPLLVAVSLIGWVWASAPAHAAGLSDPDALTFHDGSMTVTTDGAVIENLEIKGTLRIEASNVTVRNTWIYGSEFWTVYVASGSARFENVEIGHRDHLGSRGIGGNNITAINVDIHHVEDGIKLGSNSVYSGVRVHDLASPASKPHTDAVQVEGRVSNSVVKNSFLSPVGSRGVGNAAVIIKSDFGPQSGIRFQNNYMNGGNYTIYVRDGGHGVPSDISFTGNRFGDDRRYGLSSLDGPVTWTDNTWASTGETIDAAGNVIGGSATTTTTAPPTTTTTAPPTTTTTAPPTTTTTGPPTTTTSTTVASESTSTTTADTTTTTDDPGDAGGVHQQAPPPPSATSDSSEASPSASIAVPDGGDQRGTPGEGPDETTDGDPRVAGLGGPTAGTGSGGESGVVLGLLAGLTAIATMLFLVGLRSRL